MVAANRASSSTCRRSIHPGDPNQIPYAVSKVAINQLTKVLSLSLARTTIRVTPSPGHDLTDLARAS